MNLINKAREGKMIVVSTLQVQYYRSKNIVLQIFLKQKTKMLNSLPKEMVSYYSNTTNVRLHTAPMSSFKM